MKCVKVAAVLITMNNNQKKQPQKVHIYTCEYCFAFSHSSSPLASICFGDWFHVCG